MLEEQQQLKAAIDDLAIQVRRLAGGAVMMNERIVRLEEEMHEGFAERRIAFAYATVLATGASRAVISLAPTSPRSRAARSAPCASHCA